MRIIDGMAVQVIIGIIILFAVIALVLWIIELGDRSRIQTKWRSLEVKPGGRIFSPEMIEDLPEPAKRYLLHSIEPGTPLPGHVVFFMKGEFLTSPTAKPMPMTASQILSVPKGLIWKAWMGSGLMKIAGYDYYSDGKGGQKFNLWGLIPFLKSSGDDITRSAAGRVGGEAFLMPSSLLPSGTVTWESIERNSAKAIIAVGNERVEVTMTFDENGALRKVALPRWSNVNPEKEFRYMPFEGTGFSDEKNFGGITIPTRFQAGWHPEDGDFAPFFFAVIEIMEYR